MSKKDRKQEKVQEPEIAPLAEKEEKKPIKRFRALFARERVLAEDKEEARALYDQSRFGEPKDGKMNYSLVEGLYLLEKGRIDLFDEENNPVNFEEFVKNAKKVEPNFWVRYCVFKDMRSRGYIVKTALKFGADFRVYDRGVKPGEDHARWILYPVHEGETLTWFEFSAKNRVAHSTRKRLLVAAVDDEGDVTYWEISWKRP